MVELLVAMTLSLVIVGSMTGLVRPAERLASTQPDAIDMHQRVRVASAALLRDLRLGGAGLDGGPQKGPLIGYLPPIVPRRVGASGAEAANVARADTLTLIWVPFTESQTTLAAPLSGETMDVSVAAGCPADAACGFADGMHAAAFDAGGYFDLLGVAAAAGSTVSVRRLGPSSGHVYAAGASVSEIVVRTYYFDAAAGQLRQYDGDATDTPVIDDVTMFRVEYFGTGEPPKYPKPVMGTANCLYDSSGVHVPGQLLAPAADGYAPLPLNLFADGPWCGSGGMQFDADLLRVRRLRLTLGVRASSAYARGRVSDLVVSFDATPRNLRAVD